MAVGEIFLSAAFQITLEKLASPMSKELEKSFGDLKKLTWTLSKIQAVLRDAEARQITNAAVKLWLSDVEEVADDAEDVLDEDGDFPRLHQLTIKNSPNFASLPKFPSLCDLVLDECNEMILGSVQFLSSLSSLKISNFRRLALLPEGLLQHLNSLKELRIQNFYRLEALKKEVGLQDLVSLQRFEILSCPKLVSLPEEGLSSALRYLSLCVCNSLQSLPKGLENLSSLEELSISKCPKLVTFPEEKLPSSLKLLRISACANLVSLPKRLNELSVLQHLAIDSCHALRSLPEEGLPASVQSLYIQRSQLLEKRCEEGGEDWNKIAHIPYRYITRF